MRIDLTQATASQMTNEPSAEQVKARSETGSVAAEHEDRTTFSSQTESLGSLVQTAMNSPEVRQDKVSSLRSAVNNGTYKLDPDEIASSMIDEHA